nr:immunoglobulin heavy chain junction region [Macaca mulatta]MOW89312.1 immunoglobulin heavy chain junction region [Macaca mulatta]MOW89602.1 immunoglobulin heavy chain junction region [Macaca mulatta]MOW92085.1 immunoglobulin heavy chain junction region [Macaca mulatta]
CARYGDGSNYFDYW